MEKRLLLFFVVTFAIMWVWVRIFPPEMPEDVATPPAIASGTDVLDTPSSPPASKEEEKGVEADTPVATKHVAVAAVEALSEKTVVVETDVFRLELTNRGARLVSAQLHDYRNSEGGPYELVAREASGQAGILPLDVRAADPKVTAEIQKALFQYRGPSTRSVAGNERAELLFEWANGLGLEVEKRIVVDGGSYTLGVEISVRDDGDELAKDVLFGSGLGEEVAQSRYTSAEKGVVDARGEVTLFSAGDIEEGEGEGVGISGVGVASHYFAAVMIPNEDGLYGARLETTKVGVSAADGTDHERQVISAALVAPSSPASFGLFLGPKKLEFLEALGPGFDSIIEFGDWMRYPALLLRGALMWIYEFVGNYGWAIVLLTVLINLVLVPLKHYSFVSMRRMQKLAPQIQRIKDRYRKVKPTDPRYQQMNQEIMGLYKEHNVNPVSGCLPMVLMIPFFFAFYRLLMASIELRQAPFFGWIQDLSAHDPFFVLPILMGLSQVATQKMTPQTTADPVQAKVMAFMPVMFTFILAWAPAGLVLYWFANNMVSMGQQVVTNRFLALREEDEAAQGSRKRKSKKASRKEQGH